MRQPRSTTRTGNQIEVRLPTAMKTIVASSIQAKSGPKVSSAPARAASISMKTRFTAESAANSDRFLPIRICRRELGNRNSSVAAAPSVPKLLNRSCISDSSISAVTPQSMTGRWPWLAGSGRPRNARAPTTSM